VGEENEEQEEDVEDDVKALWAIVGAEEDKKLARS